jgi:hypothetical protein
VVQRLLGRFLSQGFVHHDLSRACLAQSSDAIPRVVLLGRLSLYGAGAARLHEELLSVTARWIEPSLRKGPLAPYAREAENRTLDLLEDSLKPGVGTVSDLVGKRLQSSFTQDIQDLLPQLEKRGEEAKADAEEKLITRGSVEAEAMRRVLEEQKKRVIHERSRHDEDQLLLDLDSEKRQLEANRRYWDKWLENADADLQQEPERLRKFYEVVSYRIEPVGLAYLWPVTG